MSISFLLRMISKIVSGNGGNTPSQNINDEIERAK